LLLPGGLKPAPTNPGDVKSPLQLGYDLETAAGFSDLVFRRLAEGVRVNRKLHGQVAIAENLDLVLLAADEAVGAEQVGRDGFASRENVEIGEMRLSGVYNAR